MSTKPNILFMVGGSYVAGAEITNLNLIKDLHQDGYNVLVVVSGWNDGDFINRLTQANIPYKSIKLGFILLKKLSWTLDSLIHYPQALLQLKNIIKQFKPNWIFHSSYRTFLMGYPLFKNLKNIYREHDDPLINKSNKNLYRFLGKRITKFICPTNTVKNTLCSLAISKDKITVIPSPIDNELIISAASYKEEHNTNTIKIGIIGQIIPRKGFDFIIKELNKIKIDFNLYIYGVDATEYAQKIKQSVPPSLKNKIKWMGFVREREKIYPHLDLVLFPSLSESFGRIIIEAGTYGIPTVASDLDCFKEIIQHGKTGFLFPLSDTAKLVPYVEELLSNEQKRKAMGESARQYVVSNFASEKCTEIFKALLNE